MSYGTTKNPRASLHSEHASRFINKDQLGQTRVDPKQAGDLFIGETPAVGNVFSWFNLLMFLGTFGSPPNSSQICIISRAGTPWWITGQYKPRGIFEPLPRSLLLFSNAKSIPGYLFWNWWFYAHDICLTSFKCDSWLQIV